MVSAAFVATKPEVREHGDRRRLGGAVPAILVWEEPPGDGREASSQRIDHDAIADALRLRPGKWARICNGAAFSASAIRSGALRAYRPSGSFEAAVRCGATYLRYVGEPTDSPASPAVSAASTG